MTPQRSHEPIVTFIGALPPPVTGMTAITKVVVDALESRAAVRKFDWSRGKSLMGWRWKAARIWGAAKAFVGLPFKGPAHGAKLYYAVSSGAGLYYDLAIALMGRVLGYRLVLHHHVYTYITRRDWRVALLDRIAGRTGAHAVYCEMMRDDFLNVYDSKAQFLIVPPTIVAQQLERVEPQPRDEFTIGFLSNLTIAKGILDAIATFERLATEGRRVRLMLAGPCLSSQVQQIVDDAVARWPGRVEYVGAVYDRDKARFFASLDVFLFPTRHPHESWGIVLNEALAFGCPVIARSPGCVKWIVRDGCGALVDTNGDFVPVATRLITQWIDDPQRYAAARAAAKRRADILEEQARRELPEFVDRLLTLGASEDSRPSSSFVEADR